MPDTKAPVQPDAGPWRNAIVGLEWVPVDSLLFHPDNPKIHPEKQLRAIGDLIDQVGLIDTVVVNQRTGHLIDGHGRALKAMELGQTHLPALIVDIPQEDEGVALFGFDAVSRWAQWSHQQHTDQIEGTRSATLRDLFSFLTTKKEKPAPAVLSDPGEDFSIPADERVEQQRFPTEASGYELEPEPDGDVEHVMEFRYGPERWRVVSNRMALVRDYFGSDTQEDTLAYALSYVVESLDLGRANTKA